MKFRQLHASSAMVAALAFFLTAGLIAAPAQASSPAVPEDSPPAVSSQVGGGETAQPKGVKSWFVKQALHGVAGTIRGGAGKFVDLAGPWLDDAAEVALRRDSGRIADVIEDVANIPDIASHAVRGYVYDGLKGFLGHGTANVIANAVEGVMWILL